MNTPKMEKGTEKWNGKPHARDRPTDQAVSIAKIQIRLPLGHTIGIVRRPMSPSPISSRKSWAWIVEKMIRALITKEIVFRAVMVDRPGTENACLVSITVGAYVKEEGSVERTSYYCRGARVEGRITPRVTEVAHQPM